MEQEPEKFSFMEAFKKIEEIARADHRISDLHMHMHTSATKEVARARNFNKQPLHQGLERGRSAMMSQFSFCFDLWNLMCKLGSLPVT
jgi:predicted metal-binding protein